MAKQKKRGFFSWLGLGQQQPDTEAETKQELTRQTEPSLSEPSATAEPSAIAEPSVTALSPAEPILAEQATAHSAVDSAGTPLITAEVAAGTEAVPLTTQVPVTASRAVEQQSVSGPLSLTEPELMAEPLSVTDSNPITETSPSSQSVITDSQTRPAREGFFSRLKRGLLKTRQNLGSGFLNLFRGKKINDELFEELEEQLLIADVGVETTSKIIRELTETANRQQLQDASGLYQLLKESMSRILQPVNIPLEISEKRPFVLLMVGVNGVGKTTTIGKLARQFQQQGKSVMLAAGDTFRAAAVEQLQAWGERNHIPVIAQHNGADSASVIFDAMQAAKARNIDVLIADTAGRLQNKSHLMEELKKIVRVMKKLDDSAPHETMLTLDASTGQNAISQTRLFHEAVTLSGISLTKLDGTAKGGVIFSLADQFAIPLRYIGVGERIEDLRPFNASDFIEALFDKESEHDSL